MLDNRIYITKLVQLYDVTGPWTTTGQVPMYDSGTQTFTPGTIPPGENFANANLTFDANRIHDTAGFTLDINTDGGLYAQSWFFMATNVSQFGYDQSYLELGGSQVNLFAGGTQIMYAIATGVGIGASPSASSKFDIRATDATAAHYPLRVRNFGDTANLFQVTGNGNVWSNGPAGIATNTIYGQDAGLTTTTGLSNVLMGRETGYRITTGSYNTIIGDGAGRGVLAANFTGNSNVLIGYSAGIYLSSGLQNTFIGNSTGTSITTGSYNTIIGQYTASLAAGLAQNIIISDGVGAVGLWKNGSNFIGFGYDPTSATLAAKVDVKAQGALITDVAFRVRNSADNANIFQVNGDKSTSFFGAQIAQSLEITQGSGNDVYISHYSQNTLPSNLIIRNNPVSGGYGGSVPAICFEGPLGRSLTIARTIVAVSDTIPGTLQTGYGANSAVFGMKNSLAMTGGADPTGTPADHFAMYAKDIIAGNSAPHFRTEVGDILKLYKETTAVAAATFVANTSGIADDSATYGGYTMGQVVAALQLFGFLA